MNKITVIGAGNGGTSIAAWLSLKGCKVKLYDKFESALTEIRNAKGILLKGKGIRGFAPIEKATSNIEEALEGSSLIMVVTPAFAHAEIAKLCAPYLVNGQIIILNPGRTGGAIEFHKVATEVNPSASFTIAETQSLIFACRITGPAEATIYEIKRKMPVAAIPTSQTQKVANILSSYFPQIQAAQSVLETSLSNIGAIFHPTPTILNIARIEAKQEFEYYLQGISPCVSKILERLDSERIALASRMGLNVPSAKQWLQEVYGIPIKDSETLYEVIQKQKAYKGILAPKTPDVRYITEDVPMSLVPLSELAKVFEIKTPVMDSIICLANIIHDCDYRKNGRNLKKLGLEKMTPDQIINSFAHITSERKVHNDDKRQAS